MIRSSIVCRLYWIAHYQFVCGSGNSSACPKNTIYMRIDQFILSRKIIKKKSWKKNNREQIKANNTLSKMPLQLLKLLLLLLLFRCLRAECWWIWMWISMSTIHICSIHSTTMFSFHLDRTLRQQIEHSQGKLRRQSGWLQWDTLRNAPGSHTYVSINRISSISTS